MIERYNKCNIVEKAALDKMYEYLGFNEIVSFEEYLEYMFKNTKENISFNHMFNHAIKHIVETFWVDYPDYKKNNYIKVFWIRPEDIAKYTAVGSKDDFDPKGVLRHYVKNNFRKLIDTIK
jgi:hypothetical protein